MRVLVTGHLGYIGPVLIDVFRRGGATITGLDVGYFRSCTVGGRSVSAPDREIVKDIRAVTSADFESQDIVVHLAALSNDPMGALNEQLTYDINLEASLGAARAAKAAGVQRFIFASSCSIYGAGDTSKALDETASFNPVSAYAVSKVETEKGLMEMADSSFSPVFMRNATAYGVSGRTRLDLVLNNLMASAYLTGVVKVLSDGTPWRPIVHIEDISQAAFAAATAPRDAVHAQAFNIGRSDANYQVRDIALAVQQVVPGSRLEITGETSGDSRSYRVDFSKALTSLPGFTPNWTLQRGAEELFAWMKDGGLVAEPMDSKRFVRLKQLKHLVETNAVDASLHPRTPL
jgi:nucleoside-diphosphate-sugar epimerase